MCVDNIIGEEDSFSKINLFLKVKRRRADGYHDIESLFVPLRTPSDRVVVFSSPQKGIFISSSLPSLPYGEDNICFKAAAAFAQFADISPSWHIHIEKNIPVAAGLGGGSGNAAAVLNILNKKIKEIDDASLRAIALSLGADVPFFLNPSIARVGGTGEIITPCEIAAELFFVLVNPLFPVSAAWAYTNMHKESENSTCSLDQLFTLLNSGNISDLPEKLVNDLAPAVFRKFPIMEMIEESMISAGMRYVGMSGSGPTLAGICENRKSAESALKNIEKTYGRAVRCFLSTSNIPV